jgi:hypothetical protein
MVYQYKIEEDSKLYLVGYRIDSDNNGVDFYALYLDDERPIDCDGCPIFFSDPSDMSKALDVSNCGCNHLSLPSTENFVYFDIAFTVYEIAEHDKTDNAGLLDSLNALCDFITFFHDDRANEKYKKIIRDAANHFTFSYDIEAYFKENEVTRFDLIKAIEWVVGATALWAKYIRPTSSSYKTNQ